MTMPIKGSETHPDQQGYREEPDDVQCRDANRNRSMLSIVSACVLIGVASDEPHTLSPPLSKRRIRV